MLDVEVDHLQLVAGDSLVDGEFLIRNPVEVKAIINQQLQEGVASINSYDRVHSFLDLVLIECLFTRVEDVNGASGVLDPRTWKQKLSMHRFTARLNLKCKHTTKLLTHW